MSFGLGIDTGGTYTDSVIYDFESDSILASSKAITTKENLVGCILESLDGLDAALLNKVKAVSLSTTLATNACIEGRGGRARLILIGCDRSVAESYGPGYGLPPVNDIIFLDGGHNLKGEVIAEPDWDYLNDEIEKIDGSVDSYAVVEIWGMNNCDFEKHTRNLIAEKTGKKVICGHELTAKINLLKRAASALLNAQLIPLITGFISSIKTSLNRRGIDAPIAIVRGDGSLMNEKFAAEHPVETLLCGPAASIEGGMNLSSEADSVIIDMGGTTSDMAIVRNGMPRLAEEGAVVGKWRTGTNSILIETMGLGGDSRISFGDDGRLTVGPGRVAPISWAASKWPVLTDKVRKVWETRKKYFFPICEFYYLAEDISKDNYYNDNERRIARILEDGPAGIMELASKMDASIIETNTERLEKYGIIGRIGLTPTDLMHINGDFGMWDSEAALVGARCLAYQLDTGVSQLSDDVYEIVRERLFIKIAKTLIEDEDKSLLSDGLSGQLEEVLLNGFRKVRAADRGRKCEEHNFCSVLTTPYSLVGIGAPSHIFLPEVARAMETRCVIPDNAPVANAVGAITGRIRAESVITVTPNYAASGILSYSVFSEGSRTEFVKYDEAVAYAREQAVRSAVESAGAKGGTEIESSITVIENSAESSYAASGDNCGTQEKCRGCPGNSYECGDAGSLILIETRVVGTAIGKPSWD